MLPTVGSDTIKTVAYAAQVGGRTLGVASMVNLVPEADRRAELEKSGNAILAAVSQVWTGYVARLLCEFVDYQVTLGKGRGIDRGFDAAVSVSSETIRTSLPDRRTNSPDYLAVFPNGAEAYTSPTVKEDDALALDLRNAVDKSGLAVKAQVLALLDSILPVVGPGAEAVRAAEKQVNDLFQAELVGRKQIIDTLWAERKNVESALGRSGRGLARFIFFDFRKDGPDSKDEPTPPAPETPDGPEPVKGSEPK